MSAAQPDPLALAPCIKCGGPVYFCEGHWREGSWIYPSISCKDRSCGLKYQPVRHPWSDNELKADWNAALRNDGSQREAGYRAGIEAAAKVIQKRMDDRFNEHGTREWDTNACYYTGAAAETYEALDEEADELIAAIRALEPKGE